MFFYSSEIRLYRFLIIAFSSTYDTNDSTKNKVSISMYLSVYIFLKMLLVLVTPFQETLAILSQQPAICEQMYRPV